MTIDYISHKCFELHSHSVIWQVFTFNFSWRHFDNLENGLGNVKEASCKKSKWKGTAHWFFLSGRRISQSSRKVLSYKHRYSWKSLHRATAKYKTPPHYFPPPPRHISVTTLNLCCRLTKCASTYWAGYPIHKTWMIFTHTITAITQLSEVFRAVKMSLLPSSKIESYQVQVTKVTPQKWFPKCC